MKKLAASVFVFTFFLASLAGISGCGAKYAFSQAKKLEKKGFYVQAVEKYLKVSRKYPKDALAPEAMYRAGEIYRAKLKIYPEGINIYLELLKNFPDSGIWLKLAKMGVFNSPSYFPMADGSAWTEVDSASTGKNMKAQWYCQEISTGVYKLTKKYFAGDKLVTTVARYYSIDNLELVESKSQDFADKTVLLKYPFNTGTSWVTEQDGRKIKLTVIAANAGVKTAAGQFDNCIKIQQEDLNLPGSYKYVYYAKDTGFVLMATGTSKTEHRSSELLSYSLKEQ
ncbi:MAG: hypothetical protein A2297_04125 [Elusimicrobia bacterium RIFOXYB2_FULL_48_7]|nr:MAG: hypothetical protein A2297_04125 [Elusimicrobia bacterium RIFOXYB2_FULL_48_7]